MSKLCIQSSAIPLVQWTVFKCDLLNSYEYRLIGWNKRNYISGALVSFDAGASLFRTLNKNYSIPIENCGVNFLALFRFYCWLENKNFLSITDVSKDIYNKEI